MLESTVVLAELGYGCDPRLANVFQFILDKQDRVVAIDRDGRRVLGPCADVAEQMCRFLQSIDYGDIRVP